MNAADKVATHILENWSAVTVVNATNFLGRRCEIQMGDLKVIVGDSILSGPMSFAEPAVLGDMSLELREAIYERAAADVAAKHAASREAGAQDLLASLTKGTTS